MSTHNIVKSARLQLEKMKIVAPFDGVITDLPYYTQGIKIPSGQLVVQIMDFDRLYMEVNLPAKDLTRLEIGQNARITNYTKPGEVLEGKISQLSPAVDSNTRTFKSVILIENPERILRPGMFVKSDIVIAKKDDVIVVPKNLILSRREGKTVFIIKKGAARKRILTLGLENPDEVEVIEGLKVDERLVVKGYETLRHKSKVKIIN